MEGSWWHHFAEGCSIKQLAKVANIVSLSLFFKGERKGKEIVAVRIRRTNQFMIIGILGRGAVCSSVTTGEGQDTTGCRIRKKRNYSLY